MQARLIDKLNKETGSYFPTKKSRRRMKFDIICSCRLQMEISSSGQTAWEFALKGACYTYLRLLGETSRFNKSKISWCCLGLLIWWKARSYFERFGPSTAEISTNNYKCCVKYMKMMPVHARMFPRVCEGMGFEYISLLLFWQSKCLSQAKAFDACC